MQFLVPQFIDVESKIIGPISARQFIILMIATGIDFLAFRLLSLVIGGIIIFFVTIFAAAIAFGKVNTQPMHLFLLNLIQTMRRPRMRLWHRAEYVEHKIEKEVDLTPTAVKPMVSQSRLAEMSLLVDTGGSYGLSAERLNAQYAPASNHQNPASQSSMQQIQLKEINVDSIRDMKLYGEK